MKRKLVCCVGSMFALAGLGLSCFAGYLMFRPEDLEEAPKMEQKQKPADLAVVKDEAVPLGDLDVEETADSSITDKQTLLSAWASLQDRNYQCGGNLYLDITAKVGGMEVMVPVELDFTLRVKEGKAHGEMTGMVSPPAGSAMEASTELYSDAETRKLFQNDGYGWNASEATHGGVFGFADQSRILPEYFGNSQFSETSESFVLNGKLSDFAGLSDGLTSDLIQLGNAGLGNGLTDGEIRQIQVSLGETDVEVVFAKNGRMVGVNFMNGKFEGTVSGADGSHEVSVSLSGSYGFSKFGQMTESVVTPPDGLIK